MAKRKKVLIVDDDRDFIEVYKARLEKLGYESAGETDPTEARWVIRRFLPDTLILDLNMPGMSGFDLMVNLPQEFGGNPIPILVFTGRQIPTDEHEALRLGATGVFIKGKDEQALLEKLQQLIGN